MDDDMTDDQAAQLREDIAASLPEKQGIPIEQARARMQLIGGSVTQRSATRHRSATSLVTTRWKPQAGPSPGAD